jgi:hypothetical protein
MLDVQTASSLTKPQYLVCPNLQNKKQEKKFTLPQPATGARKRWGMELQTHNEV